MSKKTFVRTNLALMITSLFVSQWSFAAKVPEGTVLADVQEARLVGTEPETLDPQKMTGTPEGNIARQLFETLVITDTEGKIEAGVAKSWEHSDDHKVWTFHLRPEAKWSNGDPVTAHDFVYGWQRLADPKTASPYSDYLKILKIENAHEVITGAKPVAELGVKALDDHTFQMTLSESLPFADDLTSHYSLSPAHRATIEKHGDAWTRAQNLVNNGAYILDEHVINEKIVLKRNPQYWNDKETVINKGIFIMTEGTAAFARYRAGELDLVAVPSELYNKIKDDFASEMYRSPRLSSFAYEMNMKQPPFDDLRVRRALDISLDRKIFADKVLGRGEQPYWNWTPKYVTGGHLIKEPEYASWSNEKRYEEAKKLLTEAGYSKSNPLEFEVLYSKGEFAKKLGIALESQWRVNLGGMVKVKLMSQEWKAFLDTKRASKFQMVSSGWGADYNEASTFATYYLSDNVFNRIGFNNPEYDALVASAYKASNNEDRAKIYAKAEELLSKEHPFIALYSIIGVGVKKPYFHGYGVTDPTGHFRFKNMYITKE